MDMKKAYIYIIGVALLAACSDNLEYEQPDNYTDEIQFAVTSQAVKSRAVYNPWNGTVDPADMGVFGYAIDGSSPIEIFNNVHQTYSDGKWSCADADKRYWAPYVQYSSTEFFGYMPYNAAATLSGSGIASRTLAIPVTLDHPIVNAAVARKAGLLCNAPEHRTSPGKIPFKMDQTLTGFNVWFMLGDDMANLRNFEVTAVSVIIPNSYPKSGTAKRTYNFNGEAWTSADITWEASPAADTGNYEYSIAWKNADSSDKKLTVDGTAFKIWGADSYSKDEDGVASTTDGAFFVIPTASFNPTIKVTYDVVVKDESAEQWTTRKNVESTIQLNSTNFTGYTTGSTGKIHPIKIKIVPSYLYVLADKDQASGYLLLQ